MVHIGEGAREFSEKNLRVFRELVRSAIAAGVNLENVVSHYAVGCASSGRVNALDGNFRKPEHMAEVIILQSQLHEVRDAAPLACGSRDPGR